MRNGAIKAVASLATCEALSWIPRPGVASWHTIASKVGGSRWGAQI